MSVAVPSSKPQATREDILAKIASFNLTQKVILVGVRGYYKSMGGNPNGNDIGEYDDAFFLITPDKFESWNGNTDPSVQRAGIAKLKAGGPYLYKKGLHGMHHITSSKADQEIYQKLIATKKDVPGYTACYWALRQYGNVTILRDGKEHTDSPEARFYIDWHRGCYGTTSSEGCQTVPPPQWEGARASVFGAMTQYNQDVIPYVLIEY
jgi:hypothetical protein